MIENEIPLARRVKRYQRSNQNP